ncbi:fibronectin type III domain-containing protein [Aquimarina brevivitae]|uniref:Fibronectin type III domain protein n=1 Tax=Aquimarina brevivitae TaxID=323412 RepID=A0A4Q7P1G7_9FLAO|nr:fibronectin type III domain-containing protein [Aquimarina brevivitae]RZS93565.1 fibronectin type III domain protein [Aquimarina brevivitae]
MTQLIKLIITLGIAMLSVCGYGQLFPVQVTPQNIPPNPIYLSDYSNTNVLSDRLKVQLVLNDLSVSDLQVRLKVYIQGEGINAQSNDFVVGAPPLTLEGGRPLQLGSVDLAPYFEFQNLSGITPATYANVLPEGIYNFCYEVYDEFTGMRLSEKTCASFVLFQNDPPLLSLPFNDATIEQQDIYNILFQWTPRAVNVSNVKYEFTLVQIFDNYVDPQAAFLSSQPIFQTVVSQNSFLYDANYPPLLGGYKYAWRVRAFAAQGAEEIGVFKNQGNSEIWTFNYIAPCNAPSNIYEETITKTSAKINWSGDTEHLDYTLSYREKDAESNWYVLHTPREYLSLNSLRPGTTYQYKVAGNCELGGYEYAPLKEFTTTEEQTGDDTVTVCNVTSDAVDLSNETLLTRLLLNDLFFAGDFPITVVELTSNTSPFSGKGYVGIPWLDLPKVGVQFEGIQINTDFKLVQGSVVTTYDADWGNIGFIDDYLEFLEEDNDLNHIEVTFVVQEIEVNTENGTITVTGTNGVEVEYPIGDDYTIVDSNGTVHHVDDQGNVTEGGTVSDNGGIDADSVGGFDTNGNIEQLSAAGITVVFELSGKYAFDKIPSNERSALQHQYSTITTPDGETYDIIHKAIIQGQSDIIKGRITTENEALISRLEFKNKDGIVVNHQIDGNTVELSLKGNFGYETESIYAVVKPEEGTNQGQTIAGVFRLSHLSQKEVNVTIVSINGANIPSNIQDRLNEVYGSAAVKFVVSQDANVNIDSSVWGNDRIDVGNSGWFAHYTDDQAAIKEVYKSQRGIKEDQYYLFVTDELPSRPVAGFMPLKGQYGFIFNSAQSGSEEEKGDPADVMAHELGHGVFGLRHPFSEYNTSQSATPWLMDYASGMQLNHMDWKKMHNPDFELYLFQDDEEGEAAIVVNLEGLAEFANPDGTYTFLSRSGKPITLPEDISEVVFSTGDSKSCTQGGTDKFRIYPFGTLSSFKIGAIEYKDQSPCGGNTFTGYQSDIKYYEDVYTNNTIQKAIIGFPTVSSGNILYKVGTIDIEAPSGGEEYKADGDYEDFDFLASKLDEVTKFNEIGAKYEPALDVDVKQFILDNIQSQGFDGTSNYNNDAYVYIHATQLQKYEVLKGCFKTGVPGEMLRYITQKVSVYAGMAEGDVVIDERVFRDSYEPNAERENRNALIDHWKAYDVNYYPMIAKAIKEFTIPEDASASDIIELFKNATRFNQTYTDNWDCFWEALDIKYRKQIIKTLAEDGFVFEGYYDLSSDSEHLLLKLFKTNKVEDRQELLDFINNYKYLEYILTALDYNDMAGPFVKEVYNWLVELKPQYYNNTNETEKRYLEFTPWFNNSVAFDASGSNNYNDVDSFMLYGANWFDLAEEVESSDFRSTFNDSEDGSLDFYHKIFERQENGFTEKFAVFRGNHQPFDPVFVYLGDDKFKEFDDGLNKDSYAIVPSIYLHWLLNARRDKLNETAFRVGMNGLAIALAPFTAGGSSAFLIIEVSAASLDIYMALNEDEIREKYGDNAITFWNATYGLYNLYAAGRGFGEFFKINARQQSNGIVKISSVQLRLDQLDELATNLINADNLQDKLEFLENIEKYLKILRADTFANVAHKKQMFEKLLEVRLKVEKTLGEFSNIIIDNANLVVTRADGTNLSLGKIDFIDDNPTLIENIRFLNPGEVSSTRLVAQFKDIGFVENGLHKVGAMEILEDVALPGQFYVRFLNATENFFNSGAALRSYLSSLGEIPQGINLETNLYRSLSKASEANYGTTPITITPHTVYSSWGRYDLDGEENALYLSETLAGNKQEIAAYGAWDDFNQYRFTNINLTNFLDLTNENVLNKLKVSREQLLLLDASGDKSIMYEFTNVIASWARQNGFSGIIAPGARGRQDYKNIILFTNDAIKSKPWFKIDKLQSKLVSRGLSEPHAEEVVWIAQKLDEKIGANNLNENVNYLFSDLIDELSSNNNFKNPEDILSWIDTDEVARVIVTENINDIPNSVQMVLNQLNEIQEGVKYLRQGEEITISKMHPGNYELDVTIESGSNKGIIECKRLSGDNVQRLLKAISEKFTKDNKLSPELKSNYPKHIGQLKIDGATNVVSEIQNANAQQFINFIKTNQLDSNLTIDELKVVDELHVINNTGRFVIYRSDW